MSDSITVPSDLSPRIESSILKALQRFGPMKRRELQGKSANRKWRAREFGIVLDDVVTRGVVKRDGGMFYLDGQVLPPPSQRRRYTKEEKADAWHRAGGRCFHCGWECNPFFDAMFLEGNFGPRLVCSGCYKVWVVL